MVGFEAIEAGRLAGAVELPLSLLRERRVVRRVAAPDGLRVGAGFELLQGELAHRLQHREVNVAAVFVAPHQALVDQGRKAFQGLQRRRPRAGRGAGGLTAPGSDSAPSSPPAHTAAAASIDQPPAKTARHRNRRCCGSSSRP